MSSRTVRRLTSSLANLQRESELEDFEYKSIKSKMYEKTLLWTMHAVGASNVLKLQVTSDCILHPTTCCQSMPKRMRHMCRKEGPRATSIKNIGACFLNKTVAAPETSLL